MEKVITVTGEDDDVDNSDGGRFPTITHTAKGGSVATTPKTLSVVVKDDDDTALLTQTWTDGCTGNTENTLVTPVKVTEKGTTDDGTAVNNAIKYCVRLGSEPTGPVTVTVASGNTSIAEASPAKLTFTSKDWKMGQTVTVTGVDDTRSSPYGRNTTITHTPSGGGYSTLPPVKVKVEGHRGCLTSHH